MIYLMRIIDAQVVFDKPGSVVLWTNCHHRSRPNLSGSRAADGPGRRLGHVWPGHLLEMKSLKAIAEYRHRRPAGPGLDEMSLPMTVSLVDVSTLPGADRRRYYAQFADSDDLRDNLMFRAPKFATTWPRITAIDMVERARRPHRAPRSGRHRECRCVDNPTRHPTCRFVAPAGIAHRLGRGRPGCSTCTMVGVPRVVGAQRGVSCWPQVRGTALIAMHKMPQDRSSISREFGARRRRRSPAMRPRWAWSPCPTSRPFSISSAVPTANTPVR